MSTEVRYAKNALLWWLHDAISHPITGTMGLVGRILRSPRLMALGHHIHNFTAPNNDAWADYADAATRAGCNELYPGHVQSQDEVRHNFQQADKLGYRARPGKAANDRDIHAFLEDKGVRAWTTAEKDHYKEPELLDVTEAERRRPETEAAIAVEKAQQDLDAFLARKVTQRDAARMTDVEKDDLRVEMRALEAALAKAQSELADSRDEITLSELLKMRPPNGK